MKQKKTIDFNDLLSEIIQKIKLFKPDIKNCKKRLESLIERDYIKRDEKEK